jgi:hypothetical protein
MEHCLAHLRHIVKILDWFHIRQAYDKAISSLPKYQDQLNSSKHKVSHGKASRSDCETRIISP